ncbi:hypothetical protein [Winogradskyella sp. 3972H.M.0a.05]|uniref:hypothetical protein n=1 Tax=Winogradskyella sp. 3972H.M.0a.05 TaxID=2950277 RepID=UPI00339159D8
MRNTIILFLIFSLLGCKGEPKESAQKSAQENTPPEISLKATIVFKTNTEDEFKVMMNNIEIDEFQKKSIHFTESVLPNSKYETISVDFGANNISRNININFGRKNLKQIQIQSITLSYGGNELLIEGSNLEEHFTINKYISYDKETFTLTTQKVEGRYNPAIILKQKTINGLVR